MPFADAFANSSKEAEAGSADSHVVHQFHHQHSFSDTGTADNSNFAAFNKRTEKINCFDAGFQNFRFGYFKCRVGRRLLKDIPALKFLRWRRRLTVNRLTEGIEHPADNFIANRNLDTVPGPLYTHALLDGAVRPDIKASRNAARFQTVNQQKRMVPVINHQNFVQRWHIFIKHDLDN